MAAEFNLRKFNSNCQFGNVVHSIPREKRKLLTNLMPFYVVRHNNSCVPLSLVTVASALLNLVPKDVQQYKLRTPHLCKSENIFLTEIPNQTHNIPPNNTCSTFCQNSSPFFFDILRLQIEKNPSLKKFSLKSIFSRRVCAGPLHVNPSIS